MFSLVAGLACLAAATARSLPPMAFDAQAPLGAPVYPPTYPVVPTAPPPGSPHPAGQPGLRAPPLAFSPPPVYPPSYPPRPPATINLRAPPLAPIGVPPVPSPAAPEPPPARIPPFIHTRGSCKTTTAGQPYAMSNLTTARSAVSGRPVRLYCTILSAKDYCVGSCCDMKLNKLEMIINRGCRSSVKGLSINGKSKSTSFTEFPQFGATVLKWTQLSVSLLSSGPATLCLMVESGSACERPAALCPRGLCQFSMHDNPALLSVDTCCPTSYLYTATP